jgi:TPR repeat protein
MKNTMKNPMQFQRDANTCFFSRAFWVGALCFGLMTGGQPGWAQAPARRTKTGAEKTAAPAQARGGLTYDGLIQVALKLLENHQPAQAQAVAQKAVALEPDRYEAHVFEARSLRDQKLYPQAVHHLQTALALAPEETKPQILRAITEVRVAGLPSEGRRRLDALALVIQDADHASGDDRIKLLREFMTRSTEFLEDYSFVVELWLLRAQAALELDYPQAGWAAGHQLAELGVADSEDADARKVMAQLERKQWLGRRLPVRQENFASLEQAISAAEAGDAYAQTFLAVVRFQGNVASFPRDYGEALKWYGKAASQGFPLADLAISDFYHRGLGVPQDLGAAFNWCRRAANLGYSPAQAQLGVYYQLGFGVRRDLGEGIRWYRLAAKQGDSRAECLLGNSYLQGAGVPRDPTEAMRWIRMAAQESPPFPPADLTMAQAYQRGVVVTKDDSDALRWYSKAAQDALAGNDAETENNVAWVYATSVDGRYRNGTEAALLAEKACEATTYMNDLFVDTLAAAYAETGMWDKAIEMQQKAIQLAEAQSGDEPKKRAQDYSQRLALYRNHQPYRERSDTTAQEGMDGSKPQSTAGTTYTYDKGSFTALGQGRWQERATDGVHHFQEQGTDSAWIYLRDDSRNISVRIPVGGGWCAYQYGPLSREGGWTNLYSVAVSGQGPEPQSANEGKAAPPPVPDPLIGSQWQGRMTRTNENRQEVEFAVSLKLDGGSSCEFVASQPKVAAVLYSRVPPIYSKACTWKTAGAALYMTVTMQQFSYHDQPYTLTIDGTDMRGTGSLGNSEYSVSLRQTASSM